MRSASNLYKLLINKEINLWLKNNQFNRTVVFTGLLGFCQTFIHKVIHRKCGKGGFLHVQKELAALCVEFTLTTCFKSGVLMPVFGASLLLY